MLGSRLHRFSSSTCLALAAWAALALIATAQEKAAKKKADAA